MTITDHPASQTVEAIRTNLDVLDEILRNVPVQARSHARLEQLEAAAREALADPEIGRDRITTADVARISGCAIGTVYRYFPDRVAILDRIWPDRDSHLIARGTTEPAPDDIDYSITPVETIRAAALKASAVSEPRIASWLDAYADQL